MNFAAYLVLFSLGFLFYTYLIYPLLMGLFSWLKPSVQESSPEDWPAFTIIIPAYNEKGILAEKINNTRQLDYPANKVQIILITDGSNDGTSETDFGPDVLHLHQPQRQGKPAAINRAIPYAQHDLVVLTDANTLLSPNVLKAFALRFRKEHVAGVSGEKKVHLQGHSAASNEGVYWRWESRIKAWEAKVHSLTGAAGELLAFRKKLFRPLPEHIILDDLMLSMYLMESGGVLDYAPEAVASEAPSPDILSEFKRKVRIAAGVFQALPLLKKNWFPWPDPLFWFQWVSHRLIRWVIAPIAVWTGPVALPFCMELHPFFRYLAFFWFGFLIWTFIGALLRNRRIPIPGFFMPFYFMMMHWAFPVGAMRSLKKKQTVLWDKINR